MYAEACVRGADVSCESRVGAVDRGLCAQLAAVSVSVPATIAVFATVAVPAAVAVAVPLPLLLWVDVDWTIAAIVASVWVVWAGI